MSNQSIHIGDNAQINGSAVAAEKIENSFNSLKESKADSTTQELLKALLNQIKTLNSKVPAVQMSIVEKMAPRADSLATESKSETPDREWYEVSVKDLLEAAKAIGSVADPVLDLVKNSARYC